ncbi:hypothetical protein H9P43_006376 [Blastocladiella emersonii ATCC 22665]|nr:hypothetical protein H9P43_006376 [Blastocladiella emersonii ATCC 22665]
MPKPKAIESTFNNVCAISPPSAYHKRARDKARAPAVDLIYSRLIDPKPMHDGTVKAFSIIGRQRMGDASLMVDLWDYSDVTKKHPMPGSSLASVAAGQGEQSSTNSDELLAFPHPEEEIIEIELSGLDKDSDEF